MIGEAKMKDNKNKLPIRIKLGYGVGDLGGNLFFTVIGFWLMNFLTDNVGLAAGLAGIAILLGKVWDAITDPVVGILSDRTRSKWGRRRPWFLFGSVPLGLAFFFMFTNPHLSSQTSLLIWASILYMFLCMFYTFVNIPYNALAPELTKDFDERTSVSGYKNIFSVVGTLIGAGAALPIVNSVADKSLGWMIMGGIFGGIMTGSALVLFFATKEPPLQPKKKEKKRHLFKGYIDAFKNKPFVLILIPWIFFIMGVTIVQGSLIYYFKYVLQDEASLTFALIAMLVSAMIFIPITVKISNKLGKKNVYIIGMSFFLLILLVVFFTGHLFGLVYIVVMMFLAGIGFASNYVMPWAIVPDTIEYDYAKSKIRREGIYYSLWTFSIKIGQALAGFFIGMILMAFLYIEPAMPKELLQEPTINNIAEEIINNEQMKNSIDKNFDEVYQQLNYNEKLDEEVKKLIELYKNEGKIQYREDDKLIDTIEQSLKKIVKTRMKTKMSYEKAVENANLIQPEIAVFGIRMLVGPFTAIFIILGCIILFFYPLTKKKYNEIQEQIKKMEEQEQIS